MQAVLVTAPDVEVGERLARAVVAERLAACVNLIPGIRSFYRWEGEVQNDDEVMLVEDETFEEPIQCQGGIESVIDDVFYGQLPVPSLGGGVGYGATAVECWTLVRDQVPDGVDVPVSDAGVAPWTH